MFVLKSCLSAFLNSLIQFLFHYHLASTDVAIEISYNSINQSITLAITSKCVA